MSHDDPAESDQDSTASTGKAVSQPHDGFFRKVLSHPEDARSAVQAIFPPELVARMDLDRLRVLPGSFVDEELRQNHTDVLLSTPIDGDDTLLYLVLEHQSGPDPLMAWRMLCYVVGVIRRWVDEHPDAKELPVVLPVVVHQGDRPWADAVYVRELIKIKPETAQLVEQCLPHMSFRLEDTGQWDPDTLQDILRASAYTPMAQTMLLFMRTARRNTHVHEQLEGWLDVLAAIRRAPRGPEKIRLGFAYLVHVSETPIDRLREVIARLGPEAEEDFMTTADMLRAEGRAEAITKMLTEQLTIKFGPLPDSALAKLHAATPEQLTTWTRRVLTANTLDEALA